MLRLYVERFLMKIYFRKELKVEKEFSLLSPADITHRLSHVIWIKLYSPLMFFTPLRFSPIPEFKRT